MPGLASSEDEQMMDAGLPSDFFEFFRRSCPPDIPLQEWGNIVSLSRDVSDFVMNWSHRFQHLTSRRTRQYCSLHLHDAQNDGELASQLQGLSFSDSNQPKQPCGPSLEQVAMALKFRLEEDIKYQQSLEKMRGFEGIRLISFLRGETRHTIRPNGEPENLPEIHDEEAAAAFFITHEWYDILDMFRAECLRRTTSPIAYSPMWSFFKTLQILMNYPSMEYFEIIMDMDQKLSQQMSQDLCGIYSGTL